jgi:hypothetical protein
MCQSLLNHPQIEQMLDDAQQNNSTNRLLQQYQTIGIELQIVEDNGSVAAFREGVCVIPVEVLESYLEDLLDLSVGEVVLNLNRSPKWLEQYKLAGIFSALKRTFPQIGLMRRLKFAKIVSAEISRRRGRDGTTRTPILSLDKILNVPAAARSSSFQGAARSLIHFPKRGN